MEVPTESMGIEAFPIPLRNVSMNEECNAERR